MSLHCKLFTKSYRRPIKSAQSLYCDCDEHYRIRLCRWSQNYNGIAIQIDYAYVSHKYNLQFLSVMGFNYLSRHPMHYYLPLTISNKTWHNRIIIMDSDCNSRNLLHVSQQCHIHNNSRISELHLHLLLTRQGYVRTRIDQPPKNKYEHLWNNKQIFNKSIFDGRHWE